MVAEQRKFVEGIGQIPSAWEVKSADEVSLKITKGTTPPKADIVDHQEIPFLRVNNLGFNGAIDKKSDFIFVSRSAHEGFLARSRAYPGDILMNIVGPPLGKVSLLGDEFSEYNMNQAIVIYRLVDDVIHRDFFIAYLLSDSAQQWLQSRSKKTSGQQNLTIELCKGLPVPVPALDEQKKIAQILSTWDKAIATTEHLLANSQQQKKALMQQLLTGNKRLLDKNGVRFSGEWKRVELGDLLDYQQPTPYLVESTEYSDDFSTPVLTAGKTFILGYTDEESGIFSEKLPAIIFDDFTTASKFVDFPFKAKSSAMKILTAKKGVSIKYAYEAMQLLDFAVGGHQRHWISIYSRLVIPFPGKEEQQKIAAVLSTADQEITALQQKLDALKQEKKALMQQLLTGKRRVPLN